jgi:hypothetical protein
VVELGWGTLRGHLPFFKIAGSLEKLKMNKQVKTYRSRLVSLAYEVLNHMETPPEGTTDLEMLVLLSQAFLDVPAPEADAPKEWEGTFMFSKLDDVPASFLRRLH